MELLTLMESKTKSNKGRHQISTLKPTKLNVYFSPAAVNSCYGHAYAFARTTVGDRFMDTLCYKS